MTRLGGGGAVTSLRERLVQSLLVAAVIGGVNLYRNGVSWGDGIAAVFVFCAWLAMATVRNQMAQRRRAADRSDLPGGGQGGGIEAG
jgi:hypothetical protein